MMRILYAAFALLLVGCNGDDKVPPPPPPPPVISMAAQDWVFYPGTMPVQSPSPAEEGWYFDFPVYAHEPTTDCINDSNCRRTSYLTTASGVNLTNKTLVLVFKIETSGDPQFQYKLNPNNNCDDAAGMRAFIQQRGDNMSGQGQYEYYRWWSNPAGVYLAPGEVTLQIPVTGDAWTSVLGKRGDDPAAQAGFAAAVANLGNVGVTYGGGCFFGHGVNLSGGSARFTMKRYGAN